MPHVCPKWYQQNKVDRQDNEYNLYRMIKERISTLLQYWKSEGQKVKDMWRRSSMTTAKEVEALYDKPSDYITMGFFFSI